MMSNIHITGEGAARQPAVAGTFYPADAHELKNMIDGFYAEAHTKPASEVQAVIVPHAGYVFSGATAAKAFATIPAAVSYKRIFLIGPSHKAAFDGASVNTACDTYLTPLGAVQVDTDVCGALLRADSVFGYVPQAHAKEHCLEVQLPLLQEHLQHLPPIVPVIIGTQQLEKLEHIAAALKPYFTPDNLFVISSDFSHYPSYADANSIDKATGDAILTGSLRTFVEALNHNAERHVHNLYTSACGQCGIAVLLMLMQGRDDLSIRHLGYCNSGDSSYGGKEEVVGYHAFSIVGKEGRTRQDDKASSAAGVTFSLTPDEKHTLLRIARTAIDNRLMGVHHPLYRPEELTDTLRMKCGAFVTLTLHGKLRGCIGFLSAKEPLYLTIEDMAREAAFSDPRFYPLSQEEWPDVHIEISVLSPLRRIHSIDEFQLGRDGIYMTKQGHAGTFLPQVAAETGWNREDFLGHCARDKAGLGWDGWKEAELYTYQATVFGEEGDACHGKH